MRRGRRLAVLLLPLLLAGCAGGGETAERVLRGGRIVTLDDARPEVAALAIVGERIVAAGSEEEIEAWIGDDTDVIDLGGRLAVPGFIEGHGHLHGFGVTLQNVRLGDAPSWEAAVERVAAAAADAPPGSWIRGRGWHQEKWERPADPQVDGFPVHDALSAAVPEHPVILTHASGHASVVNAKAMQLAGIDASTADPEGGKLLRDAAGQPTGVLIETAEGLAERAWAAAQSGRSAGEVRAAAREALRLAMRECLAHGVTSFQDAGSSFEIVDLLREMADAGELDVRVWVMLRESNEALAAGLADYRTVDYGGHRLTVRAIKRAIDGALGSHGAWLLEPYADLGDDSGLNVEPLDSIEETARLAREHDYQLCVHAIGDRGNREMLDLFERRLDGDRAARWRIEHAQHLHPDDIPRFAELGVIASMQGVHCTSDGPWVPKRLGEQRSREGAYMWRALLDSGAVVNNGTDVPVEPVDPIANFHATVTRRMRDGKAFYPQQALSRIEALRSLTAANAYAAFEEADKGTLAPGKLADIVVLSRDILSVPEDRIPGTTVEMTFVGGALAYRASN